MRDGAEAAVSGSDASEDQAKANVYHMNKARIADVTHRVDRRAAKSRLADRRSTPRYDANGELALDRRQANRIANARSLRKVALQKAS